MNVKVTGESYIYETDPNLVDFWRGSWIPIVRHADHDGAVRLLRLGPVPEKKMHKVRWDPGFLLVG